MHKTLHPPIDDATSDEIEIIVDLSELEPSQSNKASAQGTNVGDLDLNSIVKPGNSLTTE